jgi:hypothetical protein
MRPGFEFLPVEEVREFIHGYDFNTMDVFRGGDGDELGEMSGLLLVGEEPGDNLILELNENGEAPAYVAREWADRTHEARLRRRLAKSHA